MSRRQRDVGSFRDLLTQQPTTPDASPFFYKGQRFNVDFLVVGTGPVKISNEQLYVESLLIVAQGSNTADVTLWRNDNIAANAVGEILGPGDDTFIGVDNRTWDFARALSVIMGQQNPLPKQAIDASLWSVVSGAADQHVQVLFGFGDEIL